MNDEEKKLFLLFLEHNPPRNYRDHIKIKHYSFYKSTSKSFSTLLKVMHHLDGGNSIETFQTNTGNTISNPTPIYNALLDCGLIKGVGSSYIITDLLTEVITYCNENNVEINSFNDRKNLDQLYIIEGMIICHLIKELALGDHNNVCTENFKKILYNAQCVYNSIPQAKINEVITSNDQCYFLQLINSVGCEISNYYRLDDAMQSQCKNLFFEHADTSNPRDVEPNDIIEKMIFLYVRQKRGTYTIQVNNQYRTNAFLRAYHKLICDTSFTMPLLDVNSIVKRSSATYSGYLLSSAVVTRKNSIPRNLLVTGCPGSGKSHYLEDLARELDAHTIKTTFHHDSTYNEFVGTYKPTPLYEKYETPILTHSGDRFTLGKPVINYTFVCGQLINAMLYAYCNENKNIVLIVDEINRGNVGVIFGDFFQLLERDSNKDYASKYQIMPNADLYQFLYSQDFMKDILNKNNGHIEFPSNLYIWGTMNSADQGVFPIDSAFRRRWEYEYKGYKENCTYGDVELEYIIKIKWNDFRNKINTELLKLNVEEDKLIGPYFITENELSDRKKVFNKLFIYLWDDVLRFNQKSLLDADSFAELQEKWNNNKQVFNFDF